MLRIFLSFFTLLFSSFNLYIIPFAKEKEFIKINMKHFFSSWIKPSSNPDVLFLPVILYEHLFIIFANHFNQINKINHLKEYQKLSAIDIQNSSFFCLYLYNNNKKEQDQEPKDNVKNIHSWFFSGTKIKDVEIEVFVYPQCQFAQTTIVNIDSNNKKAQYNDFKNWLYIPLYP